MKSIITLVVVILVASIFVPASIKIAARDKVNKISQNAIKGTSTEGLYAELIAPAERIQNEIDRGKANNELLAQEVENCQSKLAKYQTKLDVCRGRLLKGKTILQAATLAGNPEEISIDGRTFTVRTVSEGVQNYLNVQMPEIEKDITLATQNFNRTKARYIANTKMISQGEQDLKKYLNQLKQEMEEIKNGELLVQLDSFLEKSKVTISDFKVPSAKKIEWQRRLDQVRSLSDTDPMTATTTDEIPWYEDVEVDEADKTEVNRDLVAQIDEYLVQQPDSSKTEVASAQTSE